MSQNAIELEVKLKDDATRQLGGMREAAKAAGSQAEAAFQAMDEELERVQKSVRNTGIALTAMGGVSVAAFASSISSMEAYSRELSQVDTLLSGTGTSIDQVAAQIQGLGSEFGSNREQAAAMYQAISAGADPAGEAIDTVRSAAILAKAGVGDMADTVQLLAKATENFGQQGVDAGFAGDVFFGIVKSGVTDLSQLNATMGKLIATSGAVNVPMEDMGAAMAVVTRSLPTAEAVTSLSAAFASLRNPTTEAEAALAKVGLTTEEIARIMQQPQGFLDILERIQTEGPKVGVALTDAFPEREAMRSIDILTKNLGAARTEFTAFAGTAKAGGEALEAADRRAAHLDSQLARLTAAGADLRQSFFEPLAPLVGALATGVAFMADTFAALPLPIRAVIAGATVFAGIATTVLGVVIILVSQISLLQLAFIAMGGSVRTAMTPSLITWLADGKMATDTFRLTLGKLAKSELPGVGRAAELAGKGLLILNDRLFALRTVVFAFGSSMITAARSSVVFSAALRAIPWVAAAAAVGFVLDKLGVLDGMIAIVQGAFREAGALLKGEFTLALSTVRRMLADLAEWAENTGNALLQKLAPAIRTILAFEPIAFFRDFAEAAKADLSPTQKAFVDITNEVRRLEAELADVDVGSTEYANLSFLLELTKQRAEEARLALANVGQTAGGEAAAGVAKLTKEIQQALADLNVEKLDLFASRATDLIDSSSLVNVEERIQDAVNATKAAYAARAQAIRLSDDDAIVKSAQLAMNLEHEKDALLAIEQQAVKVKVAMAQTFAVAQDFKIADALGAKDFSTAIDLTVTKLTALQVAIKPVGTSWEEAARLAGVSVDELKNMVDSLSREAADDIRTFTDSAVEAKDAIRDIALGYQDIYDEALKLDLEDALRVGDTTEALRLLDVQLGRTREAIGRDFQRRLEDLVITFGGWNNLLRDGQVAIEDWQRAFDTALENASRQAKQQGESIGQGIADAFGVGQIAEAIVAIDKMAHSYELAAKAADQAREAAKKAGKTAAEANKDAQDAASAAADAATSGGILAIVDLALSVAPDNAFTAIDDLLGSASSIANLALNSDPIFLGVNKTFEELNNLLEPLNKWADEQAEEFNKFVDKILGRKESRSTEISKHFRDLLASAFASTEIDESLRAALAGVTGFNADDRILDAVLEGFHPKKISNAFRARIAEIDFPMDALSEATRRNLLHGERDVMITGAEAAQAFLGPTFGADAAAEIERQLTSVYGALAAAQGLHGRDAEIFIDQNVSATIIGFHELGLSADEASEAVMALGQAYGAWPGAVDVLATLNHELDQMGHAQDGVINALGIAIGAFDEQAGNVVRQAGSIQQAWEDSGLPVDEFARLLREVISTTPGLAAMGPAIEPLIQQLIDGQIEGLALQNVLDGFKTSSETIANVMANFARFSVNEFGGLRVTGLQSQIDALNAELEDSDTSRERKIEIRAQITGLEEELAQQQAYLDQFNSTFQDSIRAQFDKVAVDGVTDMEGAALAKQITDAIALGGDALTEQSRGVIREIFAKLAEATGKSYQELLAMFDNDELAAIVAGQEGVLDSTTKNTEEIDTSLGGAADNAERIAPALGLTAAQTTQLTAQFDALGTSMAAGAGYAESIGGSVGATAEQGALLQGSFESVEGAVAAFASTFTEGSGDVQRGLDDTTGKVGDVDRAMVDLKAQGDTTGYGIETSQDRAQVAIDGTRRSVDDLRDSFTALDGMTVTVRINSVPIEESHTGELIPGAPGSETLRVLEAGELVLSADMTRRILSGDAILGSQRGAAPSLSPSAVPSQPFGVPTQPRASQGASRDVAGEVVDRLTDGGRMVVVRMERASLDDLGDSLARVVVAKGFTAGQHGRVAPRRRRF